MSSLPNRFSPFSLIALAIFLPAAGHASTFEVYACAPLTGVCQNTPLSHPTGPLLATALDPTSGNLAQAGIGGNLGHVSGSTTVAVSVSNNSGAPIYVEGNVAQAGSRWMDSWTISAPALTGTAGTLNAAVTVDADSLVDVNATTPAGLYALAVAGWSFRVDGGGFNVVDATGGRQIDEAGVVQGYGDPGTFNFQVDFIYGQPIGWDIIFVATSQVYGWVDDGGGLFGTAEVLFQNTIQWQGISSVLDANGQPVDFSFTSDSGVDWTQSVPLQAVPLPASVWLLGSGLLTLIARRYRAG
jgi:hypothetical protein